jgi:dTDP-4-dehydrorhamnose 3,5-epimerase
MRYDLLSTPIDGVYVLRRLPICDDRGYFERVFCPQTLAGVGGFQRLEQVNHSMTAQVGAVRGLHGQRGAHAETKIVTCVRGQVFDVALDVRRGSPTYGQHYGFRLIAEEHTALLIPKGCLHGFQVLEAQSELFYFHDAPYSPGAEFGVNVTDEDLKIQWPLDVTHLSPRDAQLPSLKTLQESPL